MLERDGSDVRGSDGRDGKEAVLPLADKTDALVDGKEGGNGPGNDRRDGEEIAAKVIPLLDLDLRGRMNAVIVSRCQVDDGVEDSAVWVFLLGRHAKQSPDVIVESLYLLDLVVGLIDESHREDRSIHRTHSVGGGERTTLGIDTTCEKVLNGAKVIHLL